MKRYTVDASYLDDSDDVNKVSFRLDNYNTSLAYIDAEKRMSYMVVRLMKRQIIDSLGSCHLKQLLLAHV